MGYFIKDLDNIASVTEPAKFSLSDNPNFVQFEALNQNANQVGFQQVVTLNLKNCGHKYKSSQTNGIRIYENVSLFSIIEKSTGIRHTFRGVSDRSELTADTFYIGSVSQYSAQWEYTYEKTAETLRDCLMKNNFINTNFDVYIPFSRYEGQLTIGRSVSLKAKKNVQNCAFTIEGGGDFFSYTGNPAEIGSTDSISTGNSSAEIHIEMYKDTYEFPGMDGTPNENSTGTYVATLTKAYSGSPLWFNINTVVSPGFSTDALFGEGWHNTGTLSDARFIAHRLIDSEKNIFYISDVFYTLTGYRRTLENNDLSEYVYDTSGFMHVKPLTTQPLLFHIEGQTQFFNFILSDPDHANTLSGNLGITYKLYSQSGRFLGTKVMHTMPMHQFHPVNTIRLSMDEVMREYPNVGQIEVYLSRQSAPNEEYRLVSYPLTFRILPSFLYKVNDFAFLNSMGGWSTFNFAGSDQSDFKAKTNTFFQTHTPDKVVSSRLETVYSKDVEEQFIVQTMPVTREVAEWLRELSASKAVYELSTGRYVIVDDLNIKPNSKDDLFRLDMKYRYSDTYNAR